MIMMQAEHKISNKEKNVSSFHGRQHQPMQDLDKSVTI